MGQDIVFAHDNKKLTPKHVGLAASLHESTRKKNLVELFHNAGNCIGYETLLRVETSMAQAEIDRFVDNGNVFVPPNITRDGGFIQFAADNINLLEDTPDGKGTFNATCMAAFQTNSGSVNEQAITLQRPKCLKTVPVEMIEIQKTKKPHKPDQPDNFGKDIDTSKVVPVDRGFHKNDLIWLVKRSQNPANTPEWTDYNRTIDKSDQSITTVGFMPILNAPITAYDTIHSVMKLCQAMMEAMARKYTVITFDEAVFFKAMELIWSNPNEYKNIIVRLGGFHIILTFLKVIGKRFESSGIVELWSECDVFGPSAGENALSGKHYNRAVRGVKLTLEALWRLLCESKVKLRDDLYEKINESDDDEALSGCVEDIRQELKSIRENTKDEPSTQLWLSYLEMAAILLRFIRAERTRNWSLHRDTLEEMIPWFAAYDRVNYVRWGMVYLFQMRQLPKTAPDVYKEFVAGNFVIKTNPGRFNATSVDLGLEHIVRMCKSAGGVTGITRTETALNRWCLAVTTLCRMAQKTRSMLGLS